MLTSQAQRFCEALVERRAITREQAESLLERSAATDAPLADVAVAAGVGHKDLAAAWAAALGLPFVDVEAEAARPDVAALVPEDLARAHAAVPVSVDQRVVVVAVPAPVDPETVRALTAALAESGHEPSLAIASRQDLAAAIERQHGSADQSSVASAAADPNLTELHRLFARVVQLGGSDLHLAAGRPPFVRLVGDLGRMPDEAELSASQVRELVYSILSPSQRARFEANHELDTACAMGTTVRFRVNVYVQRGAIGAAFRLIPYEVVPFEQLGVPEVVRTWADLPRGLVLVTGPTGSGKSTTLASLIDIVNQTRQCHIITIEDPIEFVHGSKAALVNQREVGVDTDGFNIALTQALRQDPDVILVGEMRDLETISTAITAAETGHLVFGTMHTQNAAQTVDRIIDVFPPEQQGQVRIQLANSLQGVLTQQLVPATDGRSRVVASEVLIANTALRALIRDGKVHQIPNAMMTGQRQGMQRMDESLGDLVRRGAITGEQAMRRAHNVDEVARIAGVQPPSTATGM